MKIEQALHGYYEGHKLLASSVETFSQTDRRKMSILSDWDEYVPDQEDSSYLTCYPLPNSPYYVVAKTWYASEMKRHCFHYLFDQRKTIMNSIQKLLK